jgi:hypothetical protein
MTYGAVDFLALEFETDQLKGEILPALIEMEQLAPDLLTLFDPLEIEISGIVQVEDIDNIAEAMKNESTAAVLLVENLWAIKFGEAVVRANGRLLMHDRIPFEVVNETLEMFAQAES